MDVKYLIHKMREFGLINPHMPGNYLGTPPLFATLILDLLEMLTEKKVKCETKFRYTHAVFGEKKNANIHMTYNFTKDGVGILSFMFNHIADAKDITSMLRSCYESS